MKQSNNNFDFLVEYITARVVEWIMRDQNIGLEEALLLFHNSETFDKLCENGLIYILRVRRISMIC